MGRAQGEVVAGIVGAGLIDCDARDIEIDAHRSGA